MFYCFKMQTMKKIYLVLISLLSLQSFSQKDFSRYYNSWRLGLNAGGALQTADYRSCWGMAGGFTLERGLHENKTNIFSFAIRGRYLAANTYGMDFNRNYDVKSNDAYNGKYDPAVNFVDSVPMGRQYVYDNYKMKLGEGSLELQLNFNRLRERTHVLLNLWGGIGITSYRTKSDLLDGNGKLYNFSLIDSTGNRTKTLNSYNTLIDKKYESNAFGSKGGNLITFSPSAGIGFGYQFSPGFSMIWEYKVTFPQGTNADLLDGKLGVNHDKIAGSNDYYHYTGLNLVFTLRGKHKKTSSTANPDQTAYTNTVVSTNTVATSNTVTSNPIIVTPTPTVATTNTASVTSPTVATTNTVIIPPQPPVEIKPIVTYITPPVNAFVVNNGSYKISAQILNITSANQIQFKLNGIVRSNFTFNAQSHILEYNSALNVGVNPVNIVATNTAGSDNESTTVIYELPKAAGDPPIVNYINPVQPGQIMTNPTYTVKAQVLNVIAQNDISIYFNGLSIPFTYNPSTKQIVFVANLIPGSNSISITANNLVGEDTEVTNIIYQEPRLARIPPIVNLVLPTTPVYATAQAFYNFKLSVLNVVSKNNISLIFNGNPNSSFTYDVNSKYLDFYSTLAVGINTLVVTGTNTDGVDSKTITVNYKPKIDVKNPPVVTILNPVNTKANSLVAAFTFSANVTNVSATSQLQVMFNGVAVTNYSFTAPNITFPASLNSGLNTFEVTATNIDGMDSKKDTVMYTKKTVPILPVVTLINPPSTINATDNLLYNFELYVLHVNSQANVAVVFNGVPQSNFTYDAVTKKIFFQTNLAVGDNTLSVTGTNQFGSDSKIINVNYAPHADIKLPPEIIFTNPSLPNTTTTLPTFTYSATITNMLNATNGLNVKFNGSIITNYNFDGYNFEFPANLVSGNNTLRIIANNNDGSDTAKAVVGYRVGKPAPIVTITQPTGTPTVNVSSYNFQFNIQNVILNDIQVSLNGVPVTNYNFAAPQGDFIGNLNPGQNSVSVTGSNTTGSITKTEIVVYEIVANQTPTTVSTPTVAPADTSQQITICHIPPGNSQNPQTISISPSAWPAHQSHGDTQGACPVQKVNNPIKVNPRVIQGQPTNETKPAGVKSDSISKPNINSTPTPRRPR